MNKAVHAHRTLWPQKSFLVGVSLGVLLLVISLFVNYWANVYTVRHVSNSVSDILLDNIPTMNVDLFYSAGAAIFIAILGLILLFGPRRIPFVLKAIALFIVVRSFFLILTHLAPPPDALYINADDFIHKLSSGDDLFFSSHTGLPFLLALVFWKDRYIKYFFIFSAAAGATIVILGHLHYSIDVFSAFFISYGIYHMAKWSFADDYKLLLHGNSTHIHSPAA